MKELSGGKESVTIEEAVNMIKDGDHIALSGFAITRNAISITHEIIRQRKRNLTVSQSVGSMELDLLVGAGCVKEINYGGGSLDRYGQLNWVNKSIEDGTINAHEYSYLSMIFRFLAGAMGLSFMPIKSLIGSDILRKLESKGEAKEFSCPFSGEKYILVKALKPDIAIIHAQKADSNGNVFLMGPKFEVQELARASEKIIVVVEEISSDTLNHEFVTIPGYLVDLLVHQPFGAYPTNLYGYYYQDPEHIKLYVESSKDPEKFEKYLNEYILSSDNFFEFLRKSTTLKRLAYLESLAKRLL